MTRVGGSQQPAVVHPSSQPVSGSQVTGSTTPASGSQDVTANSSATHLSDLQLNSWEVSTSDGRELSPQVREKADRAVERFDSRIRNILHHDAMSLANGETPVREGDALTESQKEELVNAAKDMFLELPIGALSPQKTSQLRSFLESQGVSTDNLETKTLKDLGDVGTDLAEQWASDLKDEKPAVFYGLLGAAGAAIGTYGFLQGSDALKDLGIKPEFKTKLFGDHVKVKAEAMWGRRLSNPGLATSLEGNYRAGDLRLRSNITLDTRNLDEVRGGAGVRWGDNQNYLDAEVRLNRGGIDEYVLSGRHTGTNYDLHGTATLTDDFELVDGRIHGNYRFGETGRVTAGANLNSEGVSSLDANFRYDTDNYHVGGRGRYDLQGNDHVVELYGGYRPTENMEVGVRGGYGRDTGARVGVGFTWRF